MSITITKWVIVLTCLVLAYTCFCRLVKTNAHTFRVIRWAFASTASAALAVVYALATSPGHVLPAIAVLLLCFAWVQVSTARHWRDGVPLDFLETKNATH